MVLNSLDVNAALEEFSKSRAPFKQGGRILLVAEIMSFLYGERIPGKLWAMFYQYEYFKPLALVTCYS